MLAVVYLADRFEREPVELIQNLFLTGVVGQLALIFAFDGLVGAEGWSGPWALVTLGAAALVLPIQLVRQPEVDEIFDGIVYSVAMIGGAVCVIHLYDLPRIIEASPYRAALAPGTVPDLRDLMILASSEGFADEIGAGMVMVAAAALAGALIGTLQMRGWPAMRTAVVSVAMAVLVSGLDLLANGSVLYRGVLALAAVGVALVVKRRSVFRDRPEPLEREILVAGCKTVLVVFGASLLATVLLQATVEQPPAPEIAPPDRSTQERAVQ